MDPFFEVIARERPRLYDYFYQRIRDRDLAEDLVQETFLRTFQTMDAIPEPDLPSWMFGIARRCCLEARRAIRRARRVDRRPPRAVPREPLELDFLDRQERGLLHLRHVEGWKCREIAQAFGTSVGSVTMTLSRLYRRMRETWQPRAADLEPSRRR